MTRLLMVAVLMLTTACATKQSAAPTWINNPGDGVVGAAGTHFQGVHAQRKLAVARARQELASQRGISIESVLLINEYESGTRAGSNASQNTRVTLEKTEVKARVEQFWLNPNSGDVYVLIKPL
ncbi:MAG: hypothetical protein P1U67_01745 [Alcanivoracaceae bacterium]|nr:hypothetical protein [Alcanivoracaceae bacterium]